MEKQVGIVRAIADAIPDGRRQSHVRHTVHDMGLQRVAQIMCGYWDADDCDELRADPAFKTALGRDPVTDDPLCSQPTMSRLENSLSIRELLRIGYAIIDNFISSYESAPAVIVLDMDPTVDRTHGRQQLTFFNAFADSHCFMPFHVYEGLSGKLITTVLRTGKTPNGKEIIAVLRRIVQRLRQAWPNTKIIFRADSHHSSSEVLDWLEDNGLFYVLALQQNRLLNESVGFLRKELQRAWERTGQAYRRFHSFHHKGGTWRQARRVIARGVRSGNGLDVRYIVTNLQDVGAKYLYETVYCSRGKVELMIKEHKLFLGSDRTSCHRKEANQFRLFLHSAAYVLMHALRETCLKGTELARAQFDTIRLRLLKIGARAEVKKTFTRFHLPACYPLKDTLSTVVQQLNVVARA
jgi:hypothetical protein